MTSSHASTIHLSNVVGSSRTIFEHECILFDDIMIPQRANNKNPGKGRKKTRICLYSLDEFHEIRSFFFGENFLSEYQIAQRFVRDLKLILSKVGKYAFWLGEGLFYTLK